MVVRFLVNHFHGNKLIYYVLKEEHAERAFHDVGIQRNGRNHLAVMFMKSFCRDAMKRAAVKN